jgi:hypothetical protein
MAKSDEELLAAPPAGGPARSGVDLIAEGLKGRYVFTK